MDLTKKTVWVLFNTPCFWVLNANASSALILSKLKIWWFKLRIIAFSVHLSNAASCQQNSPQSVLKRPFVGGQVD